MNPGPRWIELAKELGAAIGRSKRPVCFILGAGCSLSSNGPTTVAVQERVRAATAARYGNLDPRDALHTLPEVEKQEIIAPLFRDVTPNSGYFSLAGLALHRPIVVLNLNWDRALSEACLRSGVELNEIDLDPSETKALSDLDLTRPILHNVHLHGIIGIECRYGTLETLPFTREVQNWIVRNGLSHTTVCIGASVVGEKDLPGLFAEWARGQDPIRRTASHWYFIREDSNDSGVDRLRRFLTQAAPFTYEVAPDVDFDTVITLAADRALLPS